MNIQNLENLLSQTAIITNSYKRVEKATGENFNIFSILGIEHYEESTHSRFISELLNSNGRHGFDNLFLVKFLDLLGIENNFFNSNKYKVETEYFIGNVTEATGGRIDILLTDRDGSQIMIENKIYAAEQPNQLERYYNYNVNGKLFYLTLYGSKSEQLFDETKYKKISYSEFIVQWLEECQKIAVENPIVRETIRQYKNLVKKITYQNINSKMENELHQLVFDNNDNLESAIKIKNILDNSRNHLVSLLDNLVKYFQKETLKYQTYNHLKEIIILPRFNYHNFKVIRLDLVFKNNDKIIYQLQLDINSYEIETIFWGKGNDFDKFNNSLINLKLSKLIINSSSNLETIKSSIETNLTEILDFTAQHKKR